MTQEDPMADEQGKLSTAEQVELVSDLEKRLKESPGELGAAGALDASVKLWDLEAVEVPSVDSGAYELASGRIRDRIVWMAKHCFVRVDDEGTFAKLRVVWHYHGKNGRWQRKGRRVLAKIVAVPEEIQAAWGKGAKPRFAPEWVMILNASAWEHVSSTQRVQAVWRAMMDERADPLEVQPGELRFFGCATQEAVSLANSLRGDPLVGSSVQLSVFDGLEDDEAGEPASTDMGAAAVPAADEVANLREAAEAMADAADGNGVMEAAPEADEEQAATMLGTTAAVAVPVPGTPEAISKTVN